MKKSTLFFILASAPFSLFAQWTPTTTSIDPPIHRIGNIGIGLAPAARLHIGKSTERPIEIKDPSLPSLPALSEAHLRLTTNFLPNLGVKIWEIDGDSELQIRTDATASNQLTAVMSVNDLGLRVNGPRVAIGGGGQQVNVGIGTEDPKSILHIDSRDEGLRISNWLGGGWDLLPVESNGAQAFGLRVAYEQQPLWVMKKDGRMGIGTQHTPSTLGSDNISAYRLFVEGGILSKEVRVRTLWADHVFEPAYHLAPLPEVEAHIRSHGRLPDTPSAAHIESSGLELGSMTVLQQVKIEELFLHLIALEKRVAELEEQAAKSAPRKTKRAVGTK